MLAVYGSGCVAQEQKTCTDVYDVEINPYPAATAATETTKIAVYSRLVKNFAVEFIQSSNNIIKST